MPTAAAVCSLTHTLLQAVSPVGQHVPFKMAPPFGQTQPPDTQLAVAGHAFPHRCNCLDPSSDWSKITTQGSLELRHAVSLRALFSRLSLDTESWTHRPRSDDRLPDCALKHHARRERLARERSRPLPSGEPPKDRWLPALSMRLRDTEIEQLAERVDPRTPADLELRFRKRGRRLVLGDGLFTLPVLVHSTARQRKHELAVRQAGTSRLKERAL
jgi:hypothetical protein